MSRAKFTDTIISLACQSCGFGVPLYKFLAHRPTLYNWCAGLETTEREFAATGDSVNPPSTDVQIAEKGLKAYWIKENLESIDGLPAMKFAHTTSRTPVHAPPRGEWGREARAVLSLKQNGAPDGVDAALRPQKSKNTIGGLTFDNAELIKLAIAFSLGAVITAMYIQMAGGPC